jgi:hypothetical protein
LNTAPVSEFSFPPRAAPARSELAARMVESHALSATDADALERLCEAGLRARPGTEEEVLQWLAAEYGLGYTHLEGIEPERALLARFPARILLKEELLPIRQEDGHIDVAVSRLFAEPGIDSLKPFTDLQLHPVLAPSEALQREIT